MIVVATDAVTARWAATPILTLQPGSSFAPLVIGPDHIPRVAIDRVQDDPALAVLSGLVHGNDADGAPRPSRRSRRSVTCRSASPRFAMISFARR